MIQKFLKRLHTQMSVKKWEDEGTVRHEILTLESKCSFHWERVNKELACFENEVSITKDATQKGTMPFCQGPHFKAKSSSDFLQELYKTMYNVTATKPLHCYFSNCPPDHRILGNFLWTGQEFIIVRSRTYFTAFLSWHFTADAMY